MNDPDHNEARDPEALPHEFETGRTLIGIRTAILSYALLAVISAAALKGKALILALLVVGGLAAKTTIGWLRERAQKLS